MSSVQTLVLLFKMLCHNSGNRGCVGKAKQNAVFACFHVDLAGA